LLADSNPACGGYAPSHTPKGDTSIVRYRTDASQKKPGFAPPPEECEARTRPGRRLLRPVGDGQIDGTSRVTENGNGNFVGSVEQSG